MRGAILLLKKQQFLLELFSICTTSMAMILSMAMVTMGMAMILSMTVVTMGMAMILSMAMVTMGMAMILGMAMVAMVTMPTNVMWITLIFPMRYATFPKIVNT
jgi:hypothetical protein